MNRYGRPRVNPRCKICKNKMLLSKISYKVWVCHSCNTLLKIDFVKVRMPKVSTKL